MKKLITIMAAAASALLAFGALGDVSAPPAGFESYASGDVFDPSVTESESTYWYAKAVDDTNIITNYAESGTSVPSLPTNVVRPDGMKENDAYPSNSNFLSLETSTPLFRSVQANSQDGTFTGSTIGDGIYLDTLVKFTASEEEFKDGALEANVDKIAIEYVEHGEESLDTNDPTDTPFTNFVIRAGYIGTSAISQKNYRAYLPDDPTLENFDKDAWHRLTVRTIANIGGNNVGFIVYLDQKPLAYDGACGDDFSPSTDAQNYYNDEIHAVYPSAVDANITGGDQIAAVAFSGNGAIDDVVFTTETPEFITASESVVVPFVADAGVTAISVSVAGVTDPISVVNGVATLPAQTTAFTVNVTVDTANGYTLGGISYGGTPVVDGEVTGYAGGDITVTTVRNNFNLFDENGDPIQGTFQTLSEAFAAEGVAMIKLAYDYDAIAFEGEDFAGYDIDGEIVLDLNGNDLDGGDDSAGVSLFRVADTLTIKDSVGGGSITYDTQYGYAIVQMNGSDAFIGAATGDAGATFNGKLFEDGYEGNIVKGYIDDANNADEGAFLWDSYVDGGSDYELVDDYWVVAPKGGSEPTEIAVPTAKTDLVYDGTEKIGVVVGTGYTLTGNIATNAGNYTATATLEAGYVWSDTTTEAKSIDWSIAPKTDAAVVVTLTSEIAEYSAQLEFPTASAAIGGDDVAGTPAWDPATISEPEAGATNTYTVTFTVTTPNYAGSTGTATFKVWKAESEEPVYPSYIDGDDAAKKAAYDDWAAYAEISSEAFPDVGGTNKDAYLLNCKPSEVEAAKAAFKFTSISYDSTQSKWVTPTTTSYNAREYNGTVTVKQYSDVGCTKESSTGTFFKAVLQ